jgi:predicted DCC family thiol-disulfide oxidoreductase YuxK
MKTPFYLQTVADFPIEVVGCFWHFWLKQSASFDYFFNLISAQSQRILLCLFGECMFNIFHRISIIEHQKNCNGSEAVKENWIKLKIWLFLYLTWKWFVK